MKGFATTVLLCVIKTSLAAINWDIYEYGVVDTFRWSRPFPEDGTDPGGYHVHCKADGKFHAKMYKLSDLLDEPPSGLKPWRYGIEEFLEKRKYPGSWDGVDHKEQDREIVVMEYTDVPEPVRHWIEEQQKDTENPKNEKKWLFGVFPKPKKEDEQIHHTVGAEPTGIPQDALHQVKKEVVPDKEKIVVFAAGAVYEVLPLWVSKGSNCERESPSPKRQPQK